MSTSYAMVGIDKKSILSIANAEEGFSISKDSSGLVKISKLADGQYAGRKCVKLAKSLNKAPDDLDKHHDESSIYLDLNASDPDNSHFIGYTTSLSNPEDVLESLMEIAEEKYGKDILLVSEYDDEYWNLFGDIEDNDLPD